LKLKVLGLGLLAMMATSAFAAMNASATGGGHFVSDAEHTIIKGLDSGTHRLHLEPDPPDGSQTGCEVATYEGTATSATTTQIDVTPTYEQCRTTPDGTIFPITHNGCTYRFTVSTGGTFGTAHLICPAGNAIEIHHPNCTITVSPTNNQNLSGVHYTTAVGPTGKHEITLDVDVTFQTTYHGGICIFLGTNKFGTLKGSSTVWGENTNQERVNITTT
jgi:hypothetical protein